MFAGYLLLSQVTSADSGKYNCVVANSVGETSSQSKILVTGDSYAYVIHNQHEVKNQYQWTMETNIACHWCCWWCCCHRILESQSGYKCFHLHLSDYTSGCSDGTTDGLEQYENINACAGEWNGHVKRGQTMIHIKDIPTKYQKLDTKTVL